MHPGLPGRAKFLVAPAAAGRTKGKPRVSPPRVMTSMSYQIADIRDRLLLAETGCQPTLPNPT
jgi:hypothetical protein